MTTATNSRCLLALAIAAATLAGCAAQDSPMGEELDPTKPVALQVTSTLEPSMGEADSRAATTVTLTKGNIGIFLDGATYTAKHNINYKYGSPSWSPATAAEALYLVAANANVCAYYPYTTANTDKTKIAMTTQDYADSKLFYYATDRTVNAYNNSRTASFAMEHAYARVMLNISLGSSYPLSSVVISSISFSNPLLPLKGTLNIANGTYLHTQLGKSSLTGLSQTLKTGNTLRRDLLVVPQELPFNAPTTVTLTIDGGKNVTATIPISALPKIEAGKQYTINIKIEGKALVPTVELTPWEVKTIGSFNGAEAVPDI